MLRLFIGTMHNRVGSQVKSREVTIVDAVAIVPLVVVILLLAFYPQFGLERSQRSVTVAVAPAQVLSSVPPATRVASR
jgi:NADH-quinone oxidoreductase subunit M